MTTFPIETSPCFAAGDDAGALLSRAGSGGHDSPAKPASVAVVGVPARDHRHRLGPATVTNLTPIGARA